MARPLTIEHEGAFYHITARGNEQKREKRDVHKYINNFRPEVTPVIL